MRICLGVCAKPQEQVDQTQRASYHHFLCLLRGFQYLMQLLSWPYSPGSHAMLSDMSLPQGSHRKSLFPCHNMLGSEEATMLRRKHVFVKFREWVRNDFNTERVQGHIHRYWNASFLETGCKSLNTSSQVMEL